MNEHENEEQLREVALQSAASIFQARRRAEEALERKTQELADSSAMMRATLESTTDGILVTDGSGRVTNFNRQYAEMWRLPAEVMSGASTGSSWRSRGRQFADPASFLAQTEAIQRLLASRNPRPAGAGRWAGARAVSRIQYLDGRNVGRVWSFRDITERRRLEIAARRLAAIVESSDDAIVSKDLNGIVISWNQAAERIFGYTAEEMVGQPIARLVPPERPNEEPEILERLRRGERIDHYETVRVRKDGTRLDVSVTISPVKDAKGRIVGASKVARDISSEKALRHELEQRVEELAEADQRKDHFLAMLAHELRNPLGPIRNATQILKQLAPAEPRLIRAREIIERQLKHRTRLLDDLLGCLPDHEGENRTSAWYGWTWGNWSTTPPRTCAAGWRRPASRSPSPSPQRRSGSRETRPRLAQILTNLLNNATKFSDPGGQVNVQLTFDPRSERAVLMVRDTGIGIEASMLARIFDPFAQADRTLDRSRGGLGLGLALVRGLVRLHGGEVRAEE